MQLTNHDISLNLATPAIWTPGMDVEEWQEELDLMFIRAKATSDFLNGQLSPTDFEEVLSATGQNPIELANGWEEGESLL